MPEDQVGATTDTTHGDDRSVHTGTQSIEDECLSRPRRPDDDATRDMTVLWNPRAIQRLPNTQISDRGHHRLIIRTVARGKAANARRYAVRPTECLGSYHH